MWQHVPVACAESMQRRPQGRGVGDTKTEKSNRTVELPPVACELLVAHRRKQSADQLACGPSWENQTSS